MGFDGERRESKAMHVIVREWMREKWHPMWWVQEKGKTKYANG